MKIVIITFVLFISPLTLANNDFQGEQFLCSKLLWGFDFISSDKVKVISTDINNQTFVKEYYYETDTELPYINLYLDEKKISDLTFSIHYQTLRVDIWTMTSGGNTTREIIPEGFCQKIQIKNILNHIENLKNLVKN